MSGIKDGGPAFPVAEDHWIADDIPWTAGMTLRDWFAGQALAGALSTPHGVALDGERCDEPSQFAKVAYRFADAMLAERNKESAP